jgi:arginase
MGVRIIAVPYDSGQRARRMGRGPLHFIDAGAASRLAEIAQPVTERLVEHREGYPMEVAMTFALQRGVAHEVREALEAGEFPLLLAGNCHNTVGVLGGYGARRIGLVWFDAHGDVNTPETTTSGFMDGMPLSMASGRSWRGMTASIPGFRVLEDRQIVLIGVREFDDGERELFDTTEIPLVSCETVCDEGAQRALAGVLDVWSAEGLDGVHVHVDMDVHDPLQVTANPYQPAGGLTPEQVQDCVRAVAAKLRVVGATVSAYDPTADPEGRALEIGLQLMELLVRSAKG